MSQEKKKEKLDIALLALVLILVVFGLVMLMSTSAYNGRVKFDDSAYYFKKQLFATALGLMAMYLISRMDYHRLTALAPACYVLALILSTAVLFFGQEYNGSKRWLALGPLSFQPSEFSKVAVILFLAWVTERTRGRTDSFGFMAKIMVLLLPIVGLVGTNNLSTAIIVMAITVLLLFLVHPKTKRFVVFACVVLVLAVIVVVYLKIQISDMATSTDFRMRRIIAWLNPEANSDKDSYQFLQGLYAIGSGGFFGKGLGNSTQKLSAIPEAQNDMILTVICEELGVFGAILILCLFGFMLYRLMFIARNAPDLYGSLIAAGIFSHIALQVILNIAVVTGLIPTTGVTLPFISYGGTAVVFLLAEMGIALGISSKIELKD